MILTRTFRSKYMKTKVCSNCNKELPLSEFYRHPTMKDGFVGKCKECYKIDVRNNRADKIDYYLEYDRNRAMLPKRVKARTEYMQTENGKRIRKRIMERYRQRSET